MVLTTVKLSYIILVVTNLQHEKEPTIMYDQATGTYTDEAIVESFVGKTVRVITTRKRHYKLGFDVEVVGTLADLNGKGYYQVTVGDHDLFSTTGNGATISFNKGSVNAAWVAASGNIIRLD